MARYAESSGQDRNLISPYAWRYRDYVIDSFNQDKPYDQFITEQIAGDLLPHKSYEEYNNNRIATGFLTIGTKNIQAQTRQFEADRNDDQIDAITRGFLGMTLSCARCHDHKFDPFLSKIIMVLLECLIIQKIWMVCIEVIIILATLVTMIFL